MMRVWIGVFALSLCFLNGVGYSQMNSQVTGMVVDEHGTPLADVQVQASSILSQVSAGSPISAYSTKDTSSTGSFTIRTWENADVTLVVNVRDKVTTYAIVKSPAENIKLVVKSEGRKLAGTIMDAANHPVPNASIAIIACAPMQNGCRQIGLSPYHILPLTADANGHFAVDKLPALPVIIWSVPPEKKDTLDELWRLSVPKPPTVDLTNNDVLNLNVVIDPPRKKQSPRIEQHRKRIEKILKDTQRRNK